jgi:predicted transcriptional regulator
VNNGPTKPYGVGHRRPQVGTSQNRICVIESGQADVRLATLQRLAEALGFPVIVGDKTVAD